MSLSCENARYIKGGYSRFPHSEFFKVGLSTSLIHPSSSSRAVAEGKHKVSLAIGKLDGAYFSAQLPPRSKQHHAGTDERTDSGYCPR